MKDIPSSFSATKYVSKILFRILAFIGGIVILGMIVIGIFNMGWVLYVEKEIPEEEQILNILFSQGVLDDNISNISPLHHVYIPGGWQSSRFYYLHAKFNTSKEIDLQKLYPKNCYQGQAVNPLLAEVKEKLLTESYLYDVSKDITPSFGDINNITCILETSFQFGNSGSDAVSYGSIVVISPEKNELIYILSDF